MKRFCLILIALILCNATGWAQVQPTNQQIVSTALTYLGYYGYTCKIFVQHVMQDLDYPLGTGYRDCYLAIGIEVSADNAVAGDIIQISCTEDPSYDASGVHTSIILTNNANGTYYCVHSNWSQALTVTADPEDDVWNPGAWAANQSFEGHTFEAHYYRLGTLDVSTVGYFADGWHDDGISQAFLDKYLALQAAGHNLGSPWNNGPYGQWVHEQNGMYIQDFQGANNGYNHPYTALVRKVGENYSVRLIKDGFWNFWINEARWISLGAAISDEYVVNGDTHQTFNRDGLVRFLSWENSGVDVQDFSGQSILTNWLNFTNPGGYRELDGIYHSGQHVTNFGDPINLISGDSYSGFYAMVNDQPTYIQPFTLTGDSTIEIGDVEPDANFTASPLTGYAPLTVQFNNLSSGTNLEYQWEFGDGQTSTVRNPQHSYAAANYYTVTLTVTNNVGNDIWQETDYIQVQNSQNLVARFTASPNPIIAPDTVHFFDTSIGGPDGWQWFFGDGGTSYEQHPAHLYQSPGDYEVGLQVYRSGGGYDSEYRPGYIEVEQFTVDFEAVPMEGYPPLSVQFLDQTNDNPNQWTWTFGDGNVSNEQNPCHTYLEPGAYDVTLFARSPRHATVITRQDFIVVVDYVVANFSATPLSGFSPLTVQFTNLSSGNPDWTYWQFGDGQTSTEANPVHTYTNPGSYTVSLNVSSPYHANYLERPNYIAVYLPEPVVLVSQVVSGEYILYWNNLPGANFYEVSASSDGQTFSVILTTAATECVVPETILETSGFWLFKVTATY